jgi:hypothetical protein
MKTHKLASPAKPAVDGSKDQAQERERRQAEVEGIVRTLTGSRTDSAARRLTFQIKQALVWPRVDEDAALLEALSAIGEIRPQNGVEGMLSVQMLAVHDAALLLLARATSEEQYPEAIERNLLLSSRCMRLFLQQVEAMQRLQGKAWQQQVVVKHMNVTEGGQAIVGTVTAAKAPAGGR